MLGEFYGLGYELRELANHLCHKIPNGTRYHAPDLKAAMVDAGTKSF